MGTSFRTLKTMASKADDDNEDPSYFCSVVEEASFMSSGSKAKLRTGGIAVDKDNMDGPKESVEVAEK